MREQGRRWAELAHTLQPDAPDLIPAMHGPNNICDRPQVLQDAIRTALNRTNSACEDVAVHSSPDRGLSTGTVSTRASAPPWRRRSTRTRS